MNDSLKNSTKELEKQLKILKKELEEKEKQLAALRDSLSRSQDIIVNVHQSLPLKIFRDYDTSIGKIIPLRLKKRLKYSQFGTSVKNQQKLKEKIKTSKNYDKDILCFPMINWDFRSQRPQHIFSEFAKKGYRVFYFTTILDKISTPYMIEYKKENIYEVMISSSHYFDIYKDTLDNATINSLIKSFNIFVDELNINPICFVMFPTWIKLLEKLKEKFDFHIIFDCVDEIKNFSNINKNRIKEEDLLLKKSNITISSATSLHKKNSMKTKTSILVPNAGDFYHFNKSFVENLIKEIEKPIIGYFGAISEWFDTKLIEFLVKQRPQYNFVFIGDTYGSDIKKIWNLPNVHFIGERPYEELPNYLQGFDACIIPFKLTPLVLSSHPIKIYEYFSAGKPVVTTKIPDLESMKDLCYISENNKDFLQKLDKALTENDPELNKKRIQFASQNTWHDRFTIIYNELKKLSILE